jgi:hypothetical protein
MKFRILYQRSSNNAQSPVRIIEETTGHEVGWINRYLDREYVRRLADRTLRTYAHNLLHFVRWWESVHHTGDVLEQDLTESTLLDYVRFQSKKEPRPAGPRLMTVWPSWIAHCAMSFRMPLARSLRVFIRFSCSVGRWAWDGRVWQ